MNIMNVLERVRQNMRDALQVKTGWGRQEVMQELDRATTKAVVDEHLALEQGKVEIPPNQRG